MITELDTTKLKDLASTALIEKNYGNQYPVQMTPYITIDTRDGEVDAECRIRMDGTPADWWNGIVLTARLPFDVDASKLCGWVMEKSAEIINLLNDGDIDGQLEYMALDAPTLEGHGGLWDAADYYEQAGDAAACAEYGITADSTDDEIDAAADNLIERALEDNIVIYGAVRYLTDMRDDLIDGEKL